MSGRSSRSGRNGKSRRVRVINITGQAPLNGSGFTVYDSAQAYLDAETRENIEEGVPGLYNVAKQN